MKRLFEARIKTFQKYIRDAKLRGFLVSTSANRTYLSEFSGSVGTLLVTPRGAELFVDARYTERARAESALPVRDIAKLESVLQRYRGAKIGIEDTISLREFKQLKTRYRGITWQVTRNGVEELRQQKDKEELQSISKGSKIIDEAFRTARKVINQKYKTGLTEIELATLIERFGREHGATGVSFEPIVAWGKNAASPHHAPSLQKIGRNNFLLLDFGFTVDGYQSDFTRTLFIGKPTGQQREVYETVLQAQQRAIQSMADGVKASEVDKAARSIITEQGYGDYFTHTTGHGVGLEIHESPILSASSSEVLYRGTVVTVEPGIYLPNKYGVRVEDMVTVKKRTKVFSAIPKDWDSMVVVVDKGTK